jgi:dihydroneopterin aldolase
VALTERVDKAIDYLTANEEVQELVQSQSAGLIDEVIEEARERTVSADNFLEAVVRSVLRRPPRWELPEPPQEVKQQAEHTARQIHGRTLHK